MLPWNKLSLWIPCLFQTRNSRSKHNVWTTSGSVSFFFEPNELFTLSFLPNSWHEAIFDCSKNTPRLQFRGKLVLFCEKDKASKHLLEVAQLPRFFLIFAASNVSDGRRISFSTDFVGNVFFFSYSLAISSQEKSLGPGGAARWGWDGGQVGQGGGGRVGRYGPASENVHTARRVYVKAE